MKNEKVARGRIVDLGSCSFIESVYQDNAYPSTAYSISDDGWMDSKADTYLLK